MKTEVQNGNSPCAGKLRILQTSDCEKTSTFTILTIKYLETGFVLRLIGTLFCVPVFYV